MGELSPRQRVVRALRREDPDRVPFEISFGVFTPELMEVFYEKTGWTDPASYFNFPVRPVSFIGPPAYKLWNKYAKYYPKEMPVGTVISEFGTGFIPGSVKHFTKYVHPLKNATGVNDILDYPLPDPHYKPRYAHLKKTVADYHAANLAVEGELACTIFETAWGIRGFEETFLDFVDNPDMVDALFDRLMNQRIVEARQYVEAGVDILRLGDDVSSQNGMLMSLNVWRRFLKPRMAKIIEAARQINKDILIFYHSDGNCTAIVPELIEIGIDILNPVQPECMNPEALKQQFGDRLSFWGTIGTQSTMPFGTPEEVRQVVKRRIETVGKGGGLLLAPTHILEPEVPWENIVAFVEAVQEFGVYR